MISISKVFNTPSFTYTNPTGNVYKNYSVGEGVQWQAGIVPLGCEPSAGRITFLVGTSPGNEGASVDIDGVLNTLSASGASGGGEPGDPPADGGAIPWQYMIPVIGSAMESGDKVVGSLHKKDVS